MVESLVACVLSLALPMPQDAARSEAGERILAEAGAIEREIARLRGRPFARPVAKEVCTRDELSGHVTRMLADPDAQEELRRDQILLRAIGLFPEGFSLQELAQSLLASQIAGFYDPKARTLRCVESGILFEQRITLVHEIYHSLQDEYFPLDPYMKGEEGAVKASDRDRARQAVVEGDAQYFTMSVYTPAHGDELRADLLGQDPAELIGLGLNQVLAQAAIPPFFADELTWPYLSGARFIGALFESGGWPAVDRAFAQPPASTEQILHPRKYLDGGDPPLAVTAPVPPFAHGFEELLRDTVGEARIAALVQNMGGGPVHATRASQGWGGDQALVLRAPEGDELLIWRLRFDSERDGEQFVAAWRRVLARSVEAGDGPGGAAGTSAVVAELAAGATRFAPIDRDRFPLPKRWSGEFALPAGACAAVAEREGDRASWLVRRGAEVILLRGRTLAQRPAIEIGELAELAAGEFR